MTVTEQEADAPVPLRVHVPPGEKVTMPVGVVAVPGEVSVIVAVHEVDCPRLIVDGLHTTPVVVARGLTIMLVVPLLPLWVVSPG